PSTLRSDSYRYFARYDHHRDLHSFPTRRSSDLQLAEELTRDSGIDPELSAHGMLMLSVADKEEALRWGQDNQRWLEPVDQANARSEEHTSELQSRENLVCRLLLEKKKKSEVGRG